jgi:hypothetical protein
MAPQALLGVGIPVKGVMFGEGRREAKREVGAAVTAALDCMLEESWYQTTHPSAMLRL